MYIYGSRGQLTTICQCQLSRVKTGNNNGRHFYGIQEPRLREGPSLRTQGTRNSRFLQGSTPYELRSHGTCGGCALRWKTNTMVGFSCSFGLSRRDNDDEICIYNSVATQVSFLDNDVVHITLFHSSYGVLPAFAMSPRGRFLARNESGLDLSKFSLFTPRMGRATSNRHFSLRGIRTRLGARGFMLDCGGSNGLLFTSETPLTCGFRGRFKGNACRCLAHRGNRGVCNLNSGNNDIGGTKHAFHVRADSDVNCSTRASSPLCGRIPFCVYRGSINYCNVCCSASSDTIVSFKERVGGCCPTFGFFGDSSSYLICCIFFNSGLRVLERCYSLYKGRTLPPG